MDPQERMGRVTSPGSTMSEGLYNQKFSNEIKPSIDNFDLMWRQEGVARMLPTPILRHHLISRLPKPDIWRLLDFCWSRVL